MARPIRHGKTNTPTWQSWSSMITRCTNPRIKRWKDYGGKGIAVCERWMIFENFLADMGERPIGMTLDRIDGSGHYSPENCKWSTPKQQAFNRPTTVIIEFADQKKCLADWAAAIGITSYALRTRIERWGLERALTSRRRNYERRT